MSETHAVVRKLRDALADDKNLPSRLATSLRKARESAEAKLDPTLFAALEWPTDLDQYQDYLHRFIRWIPQESEVTISDRLPHFYWLIDQTADDDEAAPAQSSAVFRDWLTEFARQWGSFLDTTESFGPEVLKSFIDVPEYKVGDSMVDGRPLASSCLVRGNCSITR